MPKLSLGKLMKRSSPAIQTKPKAKPNRFNGLTEEEIQQNSPPLPDYLAKDLDLVFVGINPSLTAAYRGRYYAGPGNHFYKLLHESGLVPKFVSFEEDHQLLQFGIGLTNIVDRATRSSADLSRAEIKEGSTTIDKKLREFKPKIAVFNGKCIYEVFANKTGKSDFNFGLQPQRIGETALWVVPSSSARCSSFPRMVDKLQFYSSLKKYLAYLKGEISEVDVKEFCFRRKHKHVPSTSKMWRRKNMSAFLGGGRIANEDTLNMDDSDDNVSYVRTSEFQIKEIRSKDGIEKLQENVEPKTEIQEDPSRKKNADVNIKGVNKNSEEDGYSVTNSLSLKKESMKLELKTNKNDLRNTVTQVSVTRTKEIEEAPDFVSLIKQRLNAKKRKAEEDIESFGGIN